MVNELEEFRAYTEFPEYKAEKKSDTAYLGRFTLPMLLELTGFQRILTILARGYLFRDGSDGYDRIEVARRALLAWCSLSGEKTKKAPDQETDPRLRVNFGEYAEEFPELVTPEGDGSVGLLDKDGGAIAVSVVERADGEHPLAPVLPHLRLAELRTVSEDPIVQIELGNFPVW